MAALANDSEDEALEDLFGFNLNDCTGCDDSDDDASCAPHVPKRRVGIAVERVAASSLSCAEFAARYSRPGVPVVLTGCAEGAHLTVDWWLAHHGDREVPLDVNSGGQVTCPLGAFLRGERHRTKYLRNLHLGDWFPGAADDVGLPAAMGENHLADEAKTPGNVPHTWRTWLELFICFEDCAGFPFLHRDICHTHAYSLQIEGEKEFTLFAPDDARYVYVNGQSGFSGNRSSIPDVRAPDVFARFPLFQLAAPSTVVIGPGDALFVPDGWWHTARCVSSGRPSVTLGGNFVDDANYARFIDAFADYQAVRSLATVGASFIN